MPVIIKSTKAGSFLSSPRDVQHETLAVAIVHLLGHMVWNKSTAFFSSNHPIKCIEELFSVFSYSLSSYSWLNDPFFQNLFHQCDVLKMFLLLAFLFSPHIWQTPCYLWIVRAIKMLFHKTQLIYQNTFQMFSYIFVILQSGFTQNWIATH